MRQAHRGGPRPVGTGYSPRRPILAELDVPRVDSPPVEPFGDLFRAWATPASGQQ